MEPDVDHSVDPLLNVTLPLHGRAMPLVVTHISSERDGRYRSMVPVDGPFQSGTPRSGARALRESGARRVVSGPAGRPALPDGLVAVVKQDCATCVAVMPVLTQLAGGPGPLTVYVQDDPSSFADLAPLDDTDLEVSWHHEIETVPTLLRVEGGVEVDRTVGWCRAAWEALAGTGAGSGPICPAMRPGCGSLSRRSQAGRRARRPLRRSTAARRAASSWPSSRTRSRRSSPGAGPTACPSCRRPRPGCCACSTAPPAMPHEVVAVVPPDLVELHGREGGDQRGHGRVPARVPPGGARRGRGRVHRRVQHARGARHDDAGRPGPRRQRPERRAASA